MKLTATLPSIVQGTRNGSPQWRWLTLRTAVLSVLPDCMDVRLSDCKRWIHVGAPYNAEAIVDVHTRRWLRGDACAPECFRADLRREMRPTARED